MTREEQFTGLMIRSARIEKGIFPAMILLTPTYSLTSSGFLFAVSGQGRSRSSRDRLTNLAVGFTDKVKHPDQTSKCKTGSRTMWRTKQQQSMGSGVEVWKGVADSLLIASALCNNSSPI